MQADIYESFSQWLDDLLENADIPGSAAAFCFNLYEESSEDSVWSVQLVAADKFSEDDGGDWACDEIWSSEEDVFLVSTADEEDSGRDFALTLIRELACGYIEEGAHGGVFQSCEGVGMGFVDGELEIIYKPE
ncbi:MAG: hypothetical protein IJM44_01700 [Ruminococcus sp.]|nr:hypothetical protein [Ruminococcus sp.]